MSHSEVEVVRPAVAAGDTQSLPGHVVIVGAKPQGQAPTLTLAKALARVGVEVRFAPVNDMIRSDWVKLLRSAKAVLLMSYREVGGYALSQLATAVAMDVPIVRWWVGTDVLNVITHDALRRNAARVDRIVARNVAVATHLVDELATIGIRAHYVPSVLDVDPTEIAVTSWTRETKPVLVYLPGRRKEFFGLVVIELVIASNPDLTFLVVDDETHSLAAHPNVESLGWVSDMRPLYDRAGCVLRITEHDGLPRMLIEGMLRGLYAIYSHPLRGSWEAHTTAEIDAALERYRSATSPNMEGRSATLEMLGDRPDLQMSEVIDRATIPLQQRVRGMSLAVRSALFSAHFT